MGLPYPGHRIAVIDDSGNELAPGDIGEVAIHRIAPDGVPDPVFFLEYFKNPEATANKFNGDWSRTGDLAKRDEDGYLWYQGRADDMFKAAVSHRPSNRKLPGQASGRRQRRRRAESRRNARQRGQGVHRGGRRTRALPALEDEIQRHVREHLAPPRYPRRSGLSMRCR